jgi:hypothetical protein
MKKFFDKKVDMIVIKNFLSKTDCEKCCQKVKDKKLRIWNSTDDKGTVVPSDVYIFQTPLADVFNEFVKPEKYFGQNNAFYSPLPKAFHHVKQYRIRLGEDDILLKRFPEYKKHRMAFLEFLVRTYFPSQEKEGLIHNDVDDTGFYDDCDIFTLNIYLKMSDVEEGGGAVRIWKNFAKATTIQPEEGDLLLFNPEYNHAVRPFSTGKRISLQTFLVKDKNSNNVYVRI